MNSSQTKTAPRQSGHDETMADDAPALQFAAELYRAGDFAAGEQRLGGGLGAGERRNAEGGIRKASLIAYCLTFGAMVCSHRRFVNKS